MWVESLPCLVFVALLIPFLRFLSLLWRVNQRKVNLVPLSGFCSIMLKPLYVCTVFDRNISSVLAVTTAPLRTWEMSSAFSAPRLWYPTKSLSTHVLLYVAPFRCLVFCRDECIGRSRPPSSLLSPFHPLLVLVKLQWRTNWERMELLSLVVFPIFVSLHDARIESREPWYLLRMS
jgi:hypothetical protein